MFYQPEVFIYLMLLPVFCLVVLPATFSMTRLMISVVKKNQLATKNYKVLEQEQVYDQEALA